MSKMPVKGNIVIDYNEQVISMVWEDYEKLSGDAQFDLQLGSPHAGKAFAEMVSCFKKTASESTSKEIMDSYEKIFAESPTLHRNNDGIWVCFYDPQAGNKLTADEFIKKVPLEIFELVAQQDFRKISASINGKINLIKDAVEKDNSKKEATEKDNSK